MMLKNTYQDQNDVDHAHKITLRNWSCVPSAYTCFYAQVGITTATTRLQCKIQVKIEIGIASIPPWSLLSSMGTYQGPKGSFFT